MIHSYIYIYYMIHSYIYICIYKCKYIYIYINTHKWQIELDKKRTHIYTYRSNLDVFGYPGIDSRSSVAVISDGSIWDVSPLAIRLKKYTEIELGMLQLTNKMRITQMLGVNNTIACHFWSQKHFVSAETLKSVQSCSGIAQSYGSSLATHHSQLFSILFAI